MDIVYICRPGDDNEELRYSLRSLRNIPHDRVFLFGDAPVWVRDVTVIHVPRGRDKQATAQNNLIEACKHPEVSDPFIIMNDDFYFMAPMDSVPDWNMGSLDSVIAQHLPSAYKTAMERTYYRLIELDIHPPLSYELHTPMVIDKTGMLLALSLATDIPGVHNRTLYGNLMELDSEFHEDVKVYRNSKGSEYREHPLLSTSDRTFRYHHAGRYIRETFPDAGPYEFIPKTRQLVRAHSFVLTRH